MWGSEAERGVDGGSGIGHCVEGPPNFSWTEDTDQRGGGKGVSRDSSGFVSDISHNPLSRSGVTLVSLCAVHDEWHLLSRFLVGLGGFGSLVDIGSVVLRGVRGGGAEGE